MFIIYIYLFKLIIIVLMKTYDKIMYRENMLKDLFVGFDAGV